MNSRRMITVGKIALTSMVLLVTLGLISAQAQQANPEVLRVVKGKSIVVTFPERIRTISIADDEVIDVISITPTDAVVIGKAEGLTSLYIWGESGRYRSYELKVDRSVRSQQVVLQVQMAELNRSKFNELGVDWLYRNTDDRHIAEGEKAVGSWGGVTIPDPLVRSLSANEETSALVKWVGDKQTAQIAIKALQEKGVIKLLANPTLVCLSDEEASFLVGGEIPVPVPTQSMVGSQSIAIEWKEYGVKLRFVPTIVDTNLVRLKIAPEVSSLDYSNTVSFAGWEIPAMRTRKADGTVELNSNQTVVMGGLKASETLSIERKVPILGHIPLLGFFFTSKQESINENELLILVTPRVIETVANEIIPPLPGTTEEVKP